MNRIRIRFISLVLQVSIIGYLCVNNVECNLKFTQLVDGWTEYNELIQLKLNTINNYVQTNLIDLNTFTNYLIRLNDYLSFYSTIESLNEQDRLDVCLPNRTYVCWHVEDSTNILEESSVEETTLEWLQSACHLNTINLHSINMNSLSSFTLNNTIDTLNTTFTSLKHFTTLDRLSSGLHSLTNLNNLKSFSNFNRLPTFDRLTNLKLLTNLNINRAFFISYFDKFDNEELKNVLVSFNLFMPFVCTAFLFLLCIQNQHRRKLIELNQIFHKFECVSDLREIKEDMRSLTRIIDELKLDARQNQELKIKLHKMLNNEFNIKHQLNVTANHSTGNRQFIQQDVNGNLIKSSKGDEDLSLTFNEQIAHINQQLKLSQLEQSKLKYMVCKTIESFDRILNKMKNNCELINSK